MSDNSYAILSYDDGKIRLVVGALNSRDDYIKLKNLGFRFLRAFEDGERAWVAPWSPRRANLVENYFGIEVMIEEVDLLAISEARSEQYAEYASNAEKRREIAIDAANEITNHIPAGQPILVGHHSEKRHRRDLEKVKRSMSKAFVEQGKSEYWSGRSKSSLDAARRRLEPPVIFRRVKAIQADLNRFTKLSIEYKGKPLGVYYEKWIAFLAARLSYHRALLEDVGGLVSDKLSYEVGGAVCSDDRWYPVKRVNKKSITVTHWLGVPSMTWRFTMDKLTDSMTKEEWEACDKVFTASGFVVGR